MSKNLTLEESIIDIKFNVNKKVYDNDLIVFYKRLAIGPTKFNGKSVELLIQDSIVIEYGQCLREFIDFIIKSGLQKNKNEPEVKKITLSCGKVSLSRNKTKKPLLCVSNSLGKEVFQLHDKSETVICLKLIRKVLLFGLWSELKDHTVIDTFLKIFDENHDKKNLRDFLNQNVSNQIELLEKAYQRLQWKPDDISRIHRQIWSRIEDISIYHMLAIVNDQKYEKHSRKRKIAIPSSGRESDFLFD